MNFFKSVLFVLAALMMLSLAACSFKADLRNPWEKSSKTETGLVSS